MNEKNLKKRIEETEELLHASYIREPRKEELRNRLEKLEELYEILYQY